MFPKPVILVPWCLGCPGAPDVPGYDIQRYAIILVACAQGIGLRCLVIHQHFVPWSSRLLWFAALKWSRYIQIYLTAHTGPPYNALAFIPTSWRRYYRYNPSTGQPGQIVLPPYLYHALAPDPDGSLQPRRDHSIRVMPMYVYSARLFLKKKEGDLLLSVSCGFVSSDSEGFIPVMRWM